MNRGVFLAEIGDFIVAAADGREVIAGLNHSAEAVEAVGSEGFLVFGGVGGWVGDFPKLAEAALVVFKTCYAPVGVAAAEDVADGVEEGFFVGAVLLGGADVAVLIVVAVGSEIAEWIRLADEVGVGVVGELDGDIAVGSAFSLIEGFREQAAGVVVVEAGFAAGGIDWRIEGE